jgi:hypothetical protein
VRRVRSCLNSGCVDGKMDEDAANAPCGEAAIAPAPASYAGEVKVIVAPQPAPMSPEDLKAKYDKQIAANIPNQALARKPAVACKPTVDAAGLF